MEKTKQQNKTEKPNSETTNAQRLKATMEEEESTMESEGRALYHYVEDGELVTASASNPSPWQGRLEEQKFKATLKYTMY